MKIVFGYVGVSVADHTKESLYELLEAHELDDLIDEQSIIEAEPFTKDIFLQSEYPGPYRAGNTVSIHKCFIQYLTDMENFLLILRVGILDPDAANSLVNELYSQGLIKPRKNYETY